MKQDGKFEDLKRNYDNLKNEITNLKASRSGIGPDAYSTNRQINNETREKIVNEITFEMNSKKLREKNIS